MITPRQFLFAVVVLLSFAHAAPAQIDLSGSTSAPAAEVDVLAEFPATPGAPYMLAMMATPGEPVPLEVGVVPMTGLVTINLSALPASVNGSFVALLVRDQACEVPCVAEDLVGTLIGMYLKQILVEDGWTFVATAQGTIAYKGDTVYLIPVPDLEPDDQHENGVAHHHDGSITISATGTKTIKIKKWDGQGWVTATEKLGKGDKITIWPNGNYVLH